MSYMISDGTRYCHRTRTRAVEIVASAEQATRFSTRQMAENLLAKATKKLSGFYLVELPAEPAEKSSAQESSGKTNHPVRKDLSEKPDTELSLSEKPLNKQSSAEPSAERPEELPSAADSSARQKAKKQSTADYPAGQPAKQTASADFSVEKPQFSVHETGTEDSIEAAAAEPVESQAEHESSSGESSTSDPASRGQRSSRNRRGRRGGRRRKQNPDIQESVTAAESTANNPIHFSGQTQTSEFTTPGQAQNTARTSPEQNQAPVFMTHAQDAPDPSGQLQAIPPEQAQTSSGPSRQIQAVSISQPPAASVEAYGTAQAAVLSGQSRLSSGQEKAVPDSSGLTPLSSASSGQEKAVSSPSGQPSFSNQRRNQAGGRQNRYQDSHGQPRQKTRQESGNTESKRRMFTSAERNMIYNRTEGHCGICGRFIPLEEYTIDHIIPLSKGGTNDPENLQACCSFCNKAKDDSVGDEFLRRIERIYLYQVEQKYGKKHVKKLKKILKKLK